MKRLRIMVVCGFGLGTSMVLKMTLDDVLNKYQIKKNDRSYGQRNVLGHTAP